MQCLDVVSIVREALELLLNETGILEAYGFETAYGGSQSLPKAFFDEVDESHICLFLIDNKDGVTDGVLKEYKRAKKQNRRILCVFYNEKEKPPTELQKEIIKSGIVKFSIVNEFSAFTKEAYKSVLEDIICVYRPERKMPVSDEDDANNTKIEVKKMLSADNFVINKTMFKGFDKTKNELVKTFLPYSDDAEDTSELDNLSKDFLNVILCKEKFENINFKEIRKKIIALHEPTYQNIISLRLKAVEYYFNDRPVECIGRLQKALKEAKDNTKIANWISNDIAIDLRSFSGNLENRQSSQIEYNKAQKYISENSEPLFFPVIDRIHGDIKDRIANQYFQMKTDSPYLKRFGENDLGFKKIAEYFCTAMIYGSLTHMELTRRHIIDLLGSLCFKYDNPNFHLELIKMLIIERRGNDLQSFIRIYTQSVDIVNTNDVEAIQESIKCIPNAYEQRKSQFLLFQFFGYYFSVEQYQKTSDDLFTCMDDDRTNEFSSFIVDALRENWKRLDKKLLGRLLIKIMDFGLPSLQALNHITNYRNILKKDQREIIKKAITLISSNETTIENTIECYKRFFLCFRLTATVDCTSLDEAIKTYASDFFKGDYHLDVFDKDRERCISQIERYTELINGNNQIKEQMKNITYDDSYLYNIISNIITSKKITLNWDEIQPILEAVKNTLLSPYQDYQNKSKAILLIIFFKNHYSYETIQWNEYIDFIKEQQEQILGSNYPEPSLMKSATGVNLYFNYQLMLFVFEKADLDEVTNLIINISNISDFEILKCLECIESVLTEFDYGIEDDRIILLIIQFVSRLTKDMEEDIRFYAVKCLILLTHSNYSNIVLKQLSSIMDTGTSIIKLSIIARVKEIKDDSNNAIIDYIIQKGRVDNNYLVRKISARSDGSDINQT